MDLVLGVEGDGTHSHAVLTDAEGTLLGLGANDDSSDWDQNGIAAAAAAIRSCVTEALSVADLQTDAVEASVFSLAGVDFPVDERRLSGIPEGIGLGGRCRIVNDSFAALRAGTDQPFGVVIVAGTGSVVAGRNREGDEYRSLGLGRLYGDFGSETDVSELAIQAVAEAFTGRGPQTALTALMCEAADVRSVLDLLDATARRRIDMTGFGPLVMRAAGEGDEVARSLLTRAGSMLGATAVHVMRTLGMERTAFDLVLSGALFNSAGTELVDALEACVRPLAPDARFERLAIPPVVGAALMALDLAGHPPGRSARSTLADGLASALPPLGTGQTQEPQERNSSDRPDGYGEREGGSFDASHHR
jgi:N-acetylglucosamine kinase-like BadF-type ATPase